MDEECMIEGYKKRILGRLCWLTHPELVRTAASDDRYESGLRVQSLVHALYKHDPKVWVLRIFETCREKSKRGT